MTDLFRTALLAASAAIVVLSMAWAARASAYCELALVLRREIAMALRGGPA